MGRKLYSAIATVNNSEKEWDVVIGKYESVKDAEESISRFKHQYEGTFIEVVKTEIRILGN